MSSFLRSLAAVSAFFSKTFAIWVIIFALISYYYPEGFKFLLPYVAILLGVVGAWADMLFLPVIIANTCIGIVQEIHSKKVLDKLTIVNATRIKTLREGEIKTLSSEELVRDDICIFEAGSQIPADAVVVEGNANLNESLITGEADEVAKNPGDILKA